MRIRALRERLTYANVVATIALFLALGGTASAAMVIYSGNIADNTILSRDLKDGSAVASADVVDHTLQLRDISTSARSSLSGQQGPAGPSNAYSASANGAVDIGSWGFANEVALVTVANVPAGSYLVFAYTQARRTGGPTAHSQVQCGIDPDDSADDIANAQTFVGNDAGSNTISPITMIGSHTFASTGSLTLYCHTGSNSDATFDAFGSRLVAVKVETLS